MGQSSLGLTRIGAMLVAMLALGACVSQRSTLPAPAISAQHQIVLTGTVDASNRATYVETPFSMPPGARSIEIRVEHDGRDKRTVLDLGLRDPAGFRGWSGSNKSSIFVADFEATPSFRPGPVLAGEWTLILGVPAIADGVTTSWTATVAINAPPPAAAPDPGWRRGDFHAHTGHSDGSCPDRNGLRIPCPVNETLASALRAGLDFVSVTDHNTFAQNNSLRELEPFYPAVTIIRGAEITTFLGHANALGVSKPIDFQLGGPRLPDVGALMTQIDQQGGLLSLNHPGLASGVACMGCGWTAETDYTRLAAIEVVNGGSLRAGTHEGPTSGILFWQKQLDAGHRITAIGGSDNHDPTDDAGVRQSPLGRPATIVWSQGADERAILDGVRAGRVFLDLQNVKGRLLDVEARIDGASTAMGATLNLPAAATAAFFVKAEGAPAGHVIEIVSGGVDVMEPAAFAAAGPRAYFSLAKDARHGWIRANVRAADGALLLLGNPVYVRAG